MSGVRRLKENVKVGKYLFCFQEAHTQEYVYRLKDGENVSYIMFVTATDEEGTIVAFYERDWTDPVGPSALQTFMDKFMQDAKFRQQFQVDGDPIPDELPKLDALIHPQCAKAIERINSAKQSKLRFKDFATLKTYGIDKVSRMKMDILRDTVAESEFQQIQTAVGEADVIKVLRWVKRGLLVDHAIHKVKVDKEIAANARY